MKKKVLLVIGVILVILILVLGIVYLVDLNRMQNNEPVFFSTWGRKYSPPELNTKLDLVLSLEDEITDNSAWCGTFNLIWNDLKNELAKQDIVFLEENTKTIDNLNKGTFTVDNLSNEYYITLDNGEGYGIEIYDERVHITAGERGEAVLTEEQSKWLKEILDKYALKNVSMQVKTETLTRTGATVVITDTNENHYGYDQWYRIEQNTYDGWTEVEPITDEYAFTDLGLLVGEDNMLEDKIDWSKLYGELDDGNY